MDGPLWYRVIFLTPCVHMRRVSCQREAVRSRVLKEIQRALPRLVPRTLVEARKLRVESQSEFKRVTGPPFGWFERGAKTWLLLGNILHFCFIVVWWLDSPLNC